MRKTPLKVCYFGTYRQNYSRNQIMIAGLRKVGVDVKECHETLWRGIEDRVQVVQGGWKNPRFWGRMIGAYARLLKQYSRIGDYDVMVVGYPGQFDVFLARFLARLRGKPLVWDVFMSIYLVALERKLDHSSHFFVGLLRWVEKLALNQPDLLVQDTAVYVAWLEETHHVSAQRFRLVPTGADDRLFFPQDIPHSQDGVFRVVYYGSFIPNHGVGIMVEAANLLSDDASIQFEFIGQGPEQPEAVRYAQEKGLTNITFIEWLEKPELTYRVAAADLCLGAFGDTPQSLMTVQNKIYECLAMRKAVLTGKSSVTQAVFRSGEHLVLCERNSQALASAIRALRADPEGCQRLADAGYRLFKEHFDLLHIGQTFAAILAEAIRKRAS